MIMILATVAAFLLAAPSLAATIQVPPGANLQALVNANPTGTVFVLQPGGWRQQQVTPKNGMVFRAEQPGTAYLNGSKRLNTWIPDGPGRWYATGQTQQGARNTGADCKDGFPRCNYPDDVYYDGTPLRHVTSRNAVRAGTFFFDYGADRIYIGSNPAGKVVEAAVTPFAFGGTARDVRIENLVILNYATRTQEGTVRGTGSGWVLTGNSIIRNHSLGVDAGPGWRVTSNNLSYNGMAGYGGGGADILFENNTVAFNNYAGVDAYWEGGGGKITDSTRAIVRGNCVHSNDGPGIWFDESANEAVATGNRVFNNTQAGIMFEISTGSTISGNTVFGNGSDRKGWFWEPQILISSSDGAIVEGNIVDVLASYGNGITIVSQDRKPWTPATGNAIRNNTVTLRGTTYGRMGAVTDVDADTAAVAGGNSMSGNTYHVVQVGQDYWNWNDQDRTFAQMQSIGQESGSSIDGVLPPAPTLTCP